VHEKLYNNRGTLPLSTSKVSAHQSVLQISSPDYDCKKPEPDPGNVSWDGQAKTGSDIVLGEGRAARSKAKPAVKTLIVISARACETLAGKTAAWHTEISTSPYPLVRPVQTQKDAGRAYVSSK
jgi:hypothetical protein